VHPETSVGENESPADYGWLTWERLTSDAGPALDRPVPRDGNCSMPSCRESAVAAVRRNRSGSRPGFWQPYCVSHAHGRGVEVVDGGLDWTAEFREPR
jgi:hypothetical protein